MVIDLITFLTTNSDKYAEFLKYTCEKFKSNEHKINWKCIGSIGKYEVPNGFKLLAKTGNYGHNSVNHSMALSEAGKYVESEYVIYVDADTAILYPNWDNIVIEELQIYDCFGTEYDDKLKYQKFPMIYFFAFKSKILKSVSLDFQPLVKSGSEKISRIKVSKEEACYVGKNPGDLLKCDTGWKIPISLQKNKFTGSYMSPVPMTSTLSQLPFEDSKHKKFCFQKPTHMCEWHYKNRLFITHKQASRNHSIDSEWGNAWKKRVDLYITLQS